MIDGGAGLLGKGLGAGSLAFAIAKRVVGGNGLTVLTGRYAGVASAFDWGNGLAFGSGFDAAAWGGRCALRVSAFAVFAAWGLNVAAGLFAMRCCVARCCWYANNALYVLA